MDKSQLTLKDFQSGDYHLSLMGGELIIKTEKVYKPKHIPLIVDEE